MINAILKDASSHPCLFHWFGPIDLQQLDAWLVEHGICAPDDLRDLWLRTGGGELFETETIFGPCGDPVIEGHEDLVSVNEWHRAKGMPAGYLVFHDGIALSAVRSTDSQLVTLDGKYNEQAVYADLTEWYTRLIRNEYASRYGLQP